MKPAQFNLPVIWRGCTYAAILFKWKTASGAAHDLVNWTPLVWARDFNLNPVILDAAAGIVRIALSKAATARLRLGIQPWDWLWVNRINGVVHGPFLAGTVEVRQPSTEFAEVPEPPPQPPEPLPP
jgi:hypothetical protein